MGQKISNKLHYTEIILASGNVLSLKKLDDLKILRDGKFLSLMTWKGKNHENISIETSFNKTK